MIAIDAAFSILSKTIFTLPQATISLENALRYVTAETILSPIEYGWICAVIASRIDL